METMMSYSKFVTYIKQHYGAFNSELSENLTLQYIMDRWPERDMQKVFNTLVIKHSNQYKVPPSPTVFEEIFPRAGADPAEAAEIAWNILLATDNGFSVLITDPVAQEAVVNLGGWDEFCLRRIGNPEWSRKDFVTAYKNLFRSGLQVEPRILFGPRDAIKRQVDWRWFKILGDQTVGLAMLDKAIKNMPQIEGPRQGESEIKQVMDDIANQLPETVQS
jgi:hypothetical protein